MSISFAILIYCFHFVLAVTSVAKLMVCNVHDLISALSIHRSQAENDNIVQKLTLPRVICILCRYLF
ncbi:hypothetical protein Sjap_008563 [Stephania japonica]|uniref:Secreted protein n=1 Tax=Stephania japonica TaxID=461633 RepID=A0AAP0JQ82_9MAGN